MKFCRRRTYGNAGEMMRERGSEVNCKSAHRVGIVRDDWLRASGWQMTARWWSGPAEKSLQRQYIEYSSNTSRVSC